MTEPDVIRDEWEEPEVDAAIEKALREGFDALFLKFSNQRLMPHHSKLLNGQIARVFAYVGPAHRSHAVNLAHEMMSDAIGTVRSDIGPHAASAIKTFCACIEAIRPYKIDARTEKRIRELLGQGLSMRRIATETGTSASTVHKVAKAMRTETPTQSKSTVVTATLAVFFEHHCAEQKLTPWEYTVMLAELDAHKGVRLKGFSAQEETKRASIERAIRRFRKAHGLSAISFKKPPRLS